MSKILDMKGRLQRKERDEQLRIHRSKLEILQKMIQCSTCALKCAMCGSTLKGTEGHRSSCTATKGFVFCEQCRAEYEDYMAVSQGKRKPTAFWHGKAWMDLWAAWLEYQQAIRRFRESREFTRITRVLNRLPDE